MPLYEHVFLTRQDVSAQQVDGLIKEYSQVIEEGGGKVGKTEYWGLKSLAYKMNKSRKAHYALMNIDAPPAAVAEMERRMRISSDVVRFLTVRVAEHETEPSVQMRRGERDDRRDRDGERGFRGGGRGDRGGFRGDRGGFRGDRPDRAPPRPEREAGGPRPPEREAGASTFRARPPSGGRGSRDEPERESAETPRPARPQRPRSDTSNSGT